MPDCVGTQDRSELSLGVKPGDDHMDDVGDQDDRNRQISDGAVGLGNQGEQTELGDAEVDQAAAERDQDSLQNRPALVCQGFFLRSLDGVSYAPDHGGHHVDGCRHRSENDQDGNDGCQESRADALLDHEQGRNRSG